ncbi:MAG: DMT family transporter [Thalassobaculaceae bacterium]|nr:DMT family transporter [Thalassobaculaceae bacterium]
MAPSGTAADAEARRTRYVGFALALAATVGLGLAIAVARIAFEGGTNGQSVAMVRAWFVVALVGGWCLASGRALAIDRRAWLNCLGLGLLLAHMFFGNIGAVKFIPVGVAALLFFVYPPLVSVFTALLDRRWPGLLRFAAFLVAFAGLAVMLGEGFHHLDPRGLLLGLSAGIACAVNVTWIGRVMGGRDPLVIMFHMALVAAVALSILVPATTGLTAPVTTAGWVGALGVILLQGCSIPLYFASIPKIGVETSSILNNLQPVTSIVAAYLLFGEALTGAQGVGAALVLGGIVAMQLSGRLKR